MVDEKKAARPTFTVEANMSKYLKNPSSDRLLTTDISIQRFRPRGVVADAIPFPAT
jgi:hypothetical protein